MLAFNMIVIWTSRRFSAGGNQPLNDSSISIVRDYRKLVSDLAKRRESRWNTFTLPFCRMLLFCSFCTPCLLREPFDPDKKVVKSVHGSKSWGQIISKTSNNPAFLKQFINIVVNLLDALKTSFSHRSLTARSMGKRDTISEAAVTTLTMLKVYTSDYRKIISIVRMVIFIYSIGIFYLGLREVVEIF